MKLLKKLFLVFPILGILSQSLSAQEVYNFDFYNEDYTDLVDDIVVWDTVDYSVWWGESWTIPIGQFGFTFNYGGVDYNQIIIEGGDILFDEDSDETYIFPYFTSVVDQNYWHNPITEILSPISYQLDGAVGQRIFKIQHKNVGFIDGVEADYANYQTWLYEGSNIIEFRYGESEIVSTTAFNSQDTARFGPIVGLLDENSSHPYHLLYQDAADPVLLNDPSNFGEGLIGSPPNNMVYRFTPATVSATKSIDFENRVVFQPNPSNGFFNIEIEHPDKVQQIEIFDSKGSKINTLLHLDFQNNFNLQQPKGIYFAKITHFDGAEQVQKIVAL